MLNQNSQKIFTSTVDKSCRASFTKALLKGQPDLKNGRRGLFTINRNEIPKLSHRQIQEMKDMNLAEVYNQVLAPLLAQEFGEEVLRKLLEAAYDPAKIKLVTEKAIGKTHIMWQTGGPTYSFKDYAARFFAVMLDHVLSELGQKRIVLVATSGDTGGAIAEAFKGLENIIVVVMYPKGKVSGGQQRQMTTLKDNVYAMEVNGCFDTCQALAKRMQKDTEFALEAFGLEDIFTSANSISIGRLLPQIAYPFYAYSKISNGKEKIVPAIPSGNFGNLTGTLLAWQMGLPVERIVCGVNENTTFLDFLKSGKYQLSNTKYNPSSAMDVSHPNNMMRIFHHYGGLLYDQKITGTEKFQNGVVGKYPNLQKMRKDFYVASLDVPGHAGVINEVFNNLDIRLDPHGAVGFYALQQYLGNERGGWSGRRFEKSNSQILSLVYETADPGKFLDLYDELRIDVEMPAGMKAQEGLNERIFRIESKPDHVKIGPGKQDMAEVLSEGQYQEAKELLMKQVKKDRRLA
ncbi:MAG: threonine synthase [Candidatus Micrarchaeia archaeon]